MVGPNCRIGVISQGASTFSDFVLTSGTGTQYTCSLSSALFSDASLLETSLVNGNENCPVTSTCLPPDSETCQRFTQAICADAECAEGNSECAGAEKSRSLAVLVLAGVLAAVACVGVVAFVLVRRVKRGNQALMTSVGEMRADGAGSGMPSAGYQLQSTPMSM